VRIKVWPADRLGPDSTNCASVGSAKLDALDQIREGELDPPVSMLCAG
jgi:hypothetical protein